MAHNRLRSAAQAFWSDKDRRVEYVCLVVFCLTMYLPAWTRYGPPLFRLVSGSLSPVIPLPPLASSILLGAITGLGPLAALFSTWFGLPADDFDWPGTAMFILLNYCWLYAILGPRLLGDLSDPLFLVIAPLLLLGIRLGWGTYTRWKAAHRRLG